MGKIMKGGVEHFFGGGSGGSASIDVLDTMTEINANTESDKAAGALAVKELDNSIDDKLVVSSTRTEFASTKDTVKERARILGTVTNGGSPYLEFGHYPANGSNAEDLLALHYDGTSFKIQGIKDSSETVTKTIATTDDINALRTSFQAGYSTIADAITEKGITIADNASPEEIAEAIQSIPQIKSETYTVTLNATSSEKLKYSGAVDVSSLGTVLGYGITSLRFGYNCYFNQVDTFHASCSLTDGTLTVSLNASTSTDPYVANYITGDCSATVVVFYA